MSDLTDRFYQKIRFYQSNKIPIGIVRKDANWCSFVAFAFVSGKWYNEKIFDIRLPRDDQLASVRELLEEFCDRWGIIYRRDI